MKKIIILLLFIFKFSLGFSEPISVGERIFIHSKILNENRELLIYTPPSYDFNSLTKYPVLYIVDADYNFHYVTGLIELLSSISENIPEMLVVGLSGKGTVTYRNDSKPPYDVKDKGRADKTIAYIESDVVPFINENYKTSNYKVLSGHSIGGLFSTYAMLNKPELFNVYIAISPSLWWEDQAVTKQTEKQFGNRQQVPAHYYLSLGDEQGMGVHGFLELIQSKGPRSLQLYFKHFPDESHGSVGLPSYRWALQDIFGTFRIKNKFFKDAKAVEDYYELMNKNFNTVFPISSGFLRNTAYSFSQDKAQRLAIEEALAKYFPAQVDQFRNIQIEGLIGADKIDEAENILLRAIKNEPDNFETLTNKSRIYHKKQQLTKALKAINRALLIAKEKNIRQWLLNEIIEQKAIVEKVIDIK